MSRRARRGRHDRGLRPVAGTQLADDALDVDLHGAGRDLQGSANLLVGQALGHLRQDFALPDRQRLQGAAVGLRLGGGAAQQLGNERTVEEGVALKHAADRAENVFPAGIFEQIARGACFDRRFQVIETVMSCIVMIMTRVAGDTRRISLVAARPSMRGMRMSSSARSGLW